jgi:CHASE2 domain-containing sensor protein
VITCDPLKWLGRAAHRGAEIWSPWPAREPSGLPLPPVAGYTSLLPAGALALVGAWTLRRRAAVLVWLLAAPVYVTIAGAVLAGGVEDRLPVAPILAVMGGAGLAAIITRPSAEEESKASA